jgi:hypothetical protein
MSFDKANIEMAKWRDSIGFKDLAIWADVVEAVKDARKDEKHVAVVFVSTAVMLKEAIIAAKYINKTWSGVKAFLVASSTSGCHRLEIELNYE